MLGLILIAIFITFYYHRASEKIISK